MTSAPNLPLRVLVADDEEDMLVWLSLELGSRGWEVVTVPNGPEAISSAESQQFQLIVLDHQMPGQTGLDVVRVLRAGGNDVPMVLFSARLPAPLDEFDDLKVVPISKVDHQALLRLVDGLAASAQ